MVCVPLCPDNFNILDPIHPLLQLQAITIAGKRKIKARHPFIIVNDGITLIS